MYSVFLAIEILQNYFADTRSRHIAILPTAESAVTLKRYRMLTKQVNNRLYVLVDTDANSKPVASIDPTTVLRFYLRASDPDVYEFTELPFSASDSSRLYLSNLAANQQDGRQYLSTPVPALDTTLNYVPGNLVAGGGNLYECIQSLAANAGNTVNDATHWASRGAIQAPGPADLLPFSSGDYDLAMPAPVADAAVSVFSFDTTSGLFDNLIASANLTFPIATADVPVPLSTLPTGKYLAAAGGQQGYFYFDTGAWDRSILGVMEIYNHLPAADPYSMLDASGAVKGTLFSVFLLNPLVIWKYIARTTQVKNIKDASGVYQFDNSVPQVFRSTTPIPVTETPYNEISMDYQSSAGLTTYPNMPVASPTNLQQVAVGADQLWCAEIYLNF